MKSDCLSAAELSEFLKGSGFPSREAAELHLSECRECRTRLVELHDPVEPRPLPPELLAAAKKLVPARKPRMQWTWAAAAMLTVAVLSVAVMRPWREELRVQDVTREGEVNATLRLLWPEDGARLQASDVDLRWTAVPDAMRYEIRILNARGDVVAEEATTEPRAGGLGGRLQRGQSYFWSVRTRHPDGRLTDSEIRSFGVE